MSSELELSLWTLLLFALFAASIGYVCWDWVREKEKRKRYNLWFNRQLIASLRDRDATLKRCRRKQGTIEYIYWQMSSDEYWSEREEALRKELDKLRKERNENYRPKDYYHYQEANK